MKITSKKLNENTEVKEIISLGRIPENDPLRCKPLKKGRHTDLLSTIDRSNNFSANHNSIYLNITQYLNPKHLEKEDSIHAETVIPLSNHSKKVKRQWNGHQVKRKI